MIILLRLEQTIGNIESKLSQIYLMNQFRHLLFMIHAIIQLIIHLQKKLKIVFHLIKWAVLMSLDKIYHKQVLLSKTKEAHLILLN